MRTPRGREERIANELLLKIGIRVSPRTVNKYLPRCPHVRPRGDLRWSTFLRLHAQEIIACDFAVAVTATFRLLYVFVVIEHRSHRLVHCNITAHPSAAWTLQQLREVVGYEGRYKFLIHDHDRIFASQLDESIRLHRAFRASSCCSLSHAKARHAVAIPVCPESAITVLRSARTR